MLVCISCWVHGLGQLEAVILETYYISDSIDATDLTGGGLEEGSVTCRIFIDLVEGKKKKKVYGDENHPVSISSTEPFFNNADRGETFGFELNDNKLDEQSTALDTWITLGMATDDHMGILKSEDPDGSMVGGENNDGGSEEIPGGLLTNHTGEMGVPLTQADGLITADSVPGDFFYFGIEDSSIFGDTARNTFISSDAAIQSQTGLAGPTSANQILVAQITTKGALSFRLNIEVEDTTGHTINYIYDRENVLEGETYSKWLTYPFMPGCTDPHYLEYNEEAVIDDGSCMTPVVLGCMDPAACNYDPEANFNVHEICCYPPDSCDNRDISKVCPGWQASYHSKGNILFDLYPNPVSGFTYLDIADRRIKEVRYRIVDIYGNVISRDQIRLPGSYQPELNLTGLQTGVYLFQLFSGGGTGSLFFIKK